jgi:hypothetical protein
MKESRKLTAGAERNLSRAAELGNETTVLVSSGEKRLTFFHLAAKRFVNFLRVC